MTRPSTNFPQWAMVDEGWGRKAVDFATLSEPGNCREYVAVHHRLGVDAGDRLLDVACGSGLAIELARVRGALCSGVDASARLVAVARDRNPGDWLPVPEPLATLIIKHAADRANTSTAANADDARSRSASVSAPSKYRIAVKSGARATDARNASSIVPCSGAMLSGCPAR